MFYFPGSRKPDFSKVSATDHIFVDYWQEQGWAMRHKLMAREEVFFDWIKPNSKVLSIGCGNSRLLYELKKEKKCQVTGIDLVPSVIHGLKDNGIEAYQADISLADFSLAKVLNQENAQFDYIIISELVQQLAYPENLLNKVKHSTKELIISLPNSAFYRYRLGLMFSGRFFTQWNWHPAETLRFWSHTDFLDWLEALGWQVVKTKSSNGFSLGPLKLYDLWPNLFGHQICYLVKAKT